MWRKRADQLEDSLRQAARGTQIEGPLAPLVQTALLVSTLGKEEPPPPPNKLQPGRTRLLAETNRLLAHQAQAKRRWLPMTRRIKLASALLAALLLFGLLLGTGQAMADSLPGEPLYAVKMFVEQVRMRLTRDPQERGDLSVDMAERRMDEVATIYQRDGNVDANTAKRATEQISQTMQEMRNIPEAEGSQLFERLRQTIQEQQRILVQLMGDRPDEAEPMRELMRQMERARQELHPGEGEPDGQAERAREGTPPEEEEMPDPADQPGPGPGPEATKGPGGPNNDPPAQQPQGPPGDDKPGKEGNNDDPGPSDPGQPSDSPGNPSKPGGNNNQNQDPANSQDGSQKKKH
ncbi:MAG: DUF5667 domain-containing protein [Anaerolineae bacterium]